MEAEEAVYEIQGNVKDRVFRGSGMDRREKTLGDPQISSKEDYIARLEAEL